MTTMGRIVSLVHKIGFLDERLTNFIATSNVYRILKWAQHSEDLDQDRRYLTSDIEDADVVASSYNSYGFNTGLHRPVLDIDLDIVVVPSSTPGHHHLYIDKLMTWERYAKLLQALADAGIVQQGFVNVSLQRGATMVRLPWVKK